MLQLIGIFKKMIFCSTEYFIYLRTNHKTLFFYVFTGKFSKIFKNSFPKDTETTYSHYSDNSAWKLLSFCQDERMAYKTTPQREGISSRCFSSV